MSEAGGSPLPGEGSAKEGQGLGRGGSSLSLGHPAGAAHIVSSPGAMRCIRPFLLAILLCSEHGEPPGLCWGAWPGIPCEKPRVHMGGVGPPGPQRVGRGPRAVAPA